MPDGRIRLQIVEAVSGAITTFPDYRAPLVDL